MRENDNGQVLKNCGLTNQYNFNILETVESEYVEMQLCRHT